MIVGFNFTKISAERKNSVVGHVTINNNITLKDITEAKIGLAGSNRGALRVSFAFTSVFAPDLANMLLEGDILLLLDAKKSAEVIANWAKTKVLPRDLAEPVMNNILERANIQALLLARDLNLPSPVPMPKVQINQPGTQVKEENDEVKTTKIDKKKK